MYRCRQKVDIINFNFHEGVNYCYTLLESFSFVNGLFFHFCSRTAITDKTKQATDKGMDKNK